ncbi:NADH-quinone oxidoreductase subunit C [Streptomyces sp. MST-110588]|uniref:NADH-quinone oxidoreductase subunit C n=1 Tax=Streptomyces sp. MST-110588 TaxID=2833628 RepID=UPI001F5E2DEC|nr:NADH-quinone oxidoreductase subunit C [Streptomyces sp. MST-110588]UNO41302.1 NADH-quinone oxidoreductase subunit C [Streptomyces sp. MST-110588]
MTEQPQDAATPDEPPQAPPVGWLPRAASELFGTGATAEDAYGLLTVDVPADAWIEALTVARDELGCTYFDWLSAVDEPGTGFRVCAHVAALSRPGADSGTEAGVGTGSGPAAAGASVRRLLVRTTVPYEAAALPTAVGVYAGAAWHERETHEMFGVDFTGHPHLVPLLLPENFEGHPLRKDFVLAARVAKAWPGAKEPGESEHGGPKRRQMLPPGVPDPNDWGPMKGQLPPAPARPARGARAAGAGAGAGAGAAGAGDRPVRRTRTAGAGSASQRATTGAEAGGGTGTGAGTGTGTGAEASERPVRPARRTRSVSQGSASQRAAAAAEAEQSPSAPDAPSRRASDAPWHHARPAFEDSTESPESPKTTETTEKTTDRATEPDAPKSAAAPKPEATKATEDAQATKDAPQPPDAPKTGGEKTS